MRLSAAWTMFIATAAATNFKGRHDSSNYYFRDKCNYDPNTPLKEELTSAGDRMRIQ